MTTPREIIERAEEITAWVLVGFVILVILALAMVVTFP